jgi:hypothetical protein
MKKILLFITLILALAPGAMAQERGGKVGISNMDNETFLSFQKGLSYSNVNRFAWTNVMTKISQQKQFNVIWLADALGNGNPLLAVRVMYAISNRFPITGYLTGLFPFLWNSQSGGAIGISPQSGMTCSPGIELHGSSNGDTATADSIFPNGIVADRGWIHYLTSPGYGHFIVETQINGGAWTTLSGFASVNANAAFGATVIGFTNPAVQGAGPTKMRCRSLDVGTTVTNVILDFGLVDGTRSNGFNFGTWSGSGSVTWSNLLCTNVQVTAAQWQTYNPDLVLDEHITWDAEVDGTKPSYPFFIGMLDFIRTNCPNADHVFTSIYPAGIDGSAGQIVVRTANDEVRTNCIARHLGYYDLWNVCRNSNEMVRRGFLQTDMTHPTDAMMNAWAELFVYWLGLTEVAQVPLPVTGITNFNSYSAGTAYTMTAADAQVAFGTTSPVLTITNGGTYMIYGGANLKYNGATFAANQTATIHLRKTSGTPANLASATRTVTLRVVTTTTDDATCVNLPPVLYVAQPGDVIQVYGSVSATPSAGSFQVDSAELVAIRLL